MEFKSLYLPDMIRWEKESLTDTFGRLEITPLERGFGRTLGTALRRVLLSSLEGSAPVAVRIEGVEHEFSTIPGILQDIPEIVLNIKSLIIRLEGDKSGTLKLKAAKKGTYTGNDFKGDSYLEVMNKDQEMVQLNKNCKFSMEIIVERGRGFIPADEWNIHGKEENAGTILLDSWFCPVKRVNFEVQSARVGDRTDYDHLIMDIITDGSISPEDAVDTACEILVHHLQMIPGGLEPVEKPVAIVEEKDSREETLATLIEDTGIPTRIANVLKSEGIKTVSDLIEKTSMEILNIGGFGPSSLEKVNDVLKKIGFSIND